MNAQRRAHEYEELRVPDVQLRFIPVGTEGRRVLLLRIKRSWAAPHRIYSEETGPFYARNSAGAYPLDVDQLRTAFLQAQTLEDRVRDFRRIRITAIRAGETPVPIIDGARYVMHLLPLTAFTANDLLSMSSLRESMAAFEYFDASGWSQRTNLDGVVLFQSRNEPNRAYTQVYRNGCVEAVAVYERDDDPAVAASWQERVTLKYVNQYARALFSLGVPLPIFVFLSLVDARGYRLHLGQRAFREDSTPLDRDDILLPEVSIEEPDFKAGLILKPLFDSIWHAFNCPGGTHNVNEAGDWAGATR